MPYVVILSQKLPFFAPAANDAKGRELPPDFVAHARRLAGKPVEQLTDLDREIERLSSSVLLNR